MRTTDEPIRFLTREQLRERVPYSDTQLWRLERADRFPRRVRIGPNRVAWIEAEIDHWQRVRVGERDGNEAARAAEV